MSTFREENVTRRPSGAPSAGAFAEHLRSNPEVLLQAPNSADVGGEEPTRSFLAEVGAPQHVIDKVVPLVREHMSHAGGKGKPAPSAVRRLIRRLNPDGRGPSIYDWARHRRCGLSRSRAEG
jgi:hypothetical protein